jgi:hypothetical protein
MAYSPNTIITDPNAVNVSFTIPSSTVTIPAVYSTDDYYFLVTASIVSSTTLVTVGPIAPPATGTLTLVSGTGPATLAYTAIATSANILEMANVMGPGLAATTAQQALVVTVSPNSASLEINNVPDNDFSTVNITARDTVSTTATGANGQQIITGTPTAGSVASFAFSSDCSYSVQVTGTWTGTLVSESSIDSGTTWYSTYLHQTGTPYPTTQSFTANLYGKGIATGATNFRIRSTTAWTGTATVSITTSINASSTLVLNPLALADGQKFTYSAASESLVVASTPTDVFTITGSATKTIRITQVEVSSTQTTAATTNLYLIKRSTANTGGTSTAPGSVPHDSNSPAASATVAQYTANPTGLGTTVGTIRSAKWTPATPGTAGGSNTQLWQFGNRPGAQAIVLRGTGQVLALNLGSTTQAGNTYDISFEWTEDNS